MARDGGRIRRHVFRGYVPGLVSECADGSGRGTSRRWRRDSSPLLIREESLGRPFIAGVSKLPGVVRLHPIETLLKDAMETGLRIGHPIYDCLYIACGPADVIDSHHGGSRTRESSVEASFRTCKQLRLTTAPG